MGPVPDAGPTRPSSPPPRLLLSEPHDASAEWLADGLAAREVAVEAVTTTELLGAKRWEHRVGCAGVQLEVELGDGRLIESGALHTVINRIVGIPIELLPVTEEDREYAHQELYAFWLSWLEGLPCRVLNRTTPLGLSGPWLSNAEWAMHASRAGLPTEPLRLDGRPPEPAHHLDDVVVVVVAAGAVFGPPGAAGLVEGCRGLAAAAEVEMLEVRLKPSSSSAGELCFAGATTLPDLRLGSDPLLDHLARSLA